MRKRVAESRITYDLPDELREQAERTELNYRTRITTDAQDRATTARLLSILTLVFLAVGVTLNLLTKLPTSWGVSLLAVLIAAMLVLAYRNFLRGMPSRIELGLALTGCLVTVLFAFVNFAPTVTWAYAGVFGAALLITAVFSHFATTQVCAWMAVNERLRLRTVRRWQWYLSLATRAGHTPRWCRELSSYRQSYAFLLLAYAIGLGVVIKAERTGMDDSPAILGVLAFLASLVAFRLCLPGPKGYGRPPVRGTLAVTWSALTTFLCYNRHQVDAAGLFRFPARWLRPTTARDLFLGVTLAFLSTAFVGVSLSAPTVIAEGYDRQAGPEELPDPPAWMLPKLARVGTAMDFAETLPESERGAYLDAKQRELEAEMLAARSRLASTLFFRKVIRSILAFLLCWLGPSTLLFAVIWFTGGQLLHRFYLALESPEAYSLPAKYATEPPEKELEIAAGKRERTSWDNRLERMTYSADPLETQHYYLGTSIEGDFPVLLHQDLLYRHGHIVGDTGSRKTSIGIAPLVTQIIARETNSVVIIDLKGDKTLFNAVKDEAAAAGLPFRWFTNIVGQSSFAFNPLQQSHLSRLTNDQLTQGILQALDLEHGEGYGRGHFTALNDAVLGAYLRRYRNQADSFEELYRYVSSKDAYRSIGGDAEDWRHTRQLVNLVDKLAHLGPMNVTRKKVAEKPRVIQEQIDMASVLRTPQVVYFYLSSSLDPRTVSPIAKLAMFSLLGASEFRTGIEPRCFVFVDEFQRVVSEAMALFLEQARSKGLHFILANQALSQLNSKGVDISGVVESCTGFKQSFRASDEANIKRIVEGSGEAVYHDVSWNRVVSDAYDEKTPHLTSLVHVLRRHSGEVSVNVNRTVGPRIERNTLIETSALPLASFIHFDEGSGYTRYSGYWTTMLSEYHITKPLYDFFEQEPIPAVDDRTVEVLGDPPGGFPETSNIKEGPVHKPQDVASSFDEELEKRLNAAGESIPPPGGP